MNKLAVALLLFSFCAAGPAQTAKKADQSKPEQSKADEQLTPTVRLYHPKHMQSRKRIDAVAAFVNSLVRNAMVQWEAGPQCIVIRGTTPADLDAAEALLNRFDVEEEPSQFQLVPALKPATQMIEIRAYLILATSGPTPTPVAMNAPGGPVGPTPLRPVPAEVQSAVDEMKRIFSYDHYYLADTVVMEPHGEGEIGGVLPWTAYVEPNLFYSLVFNYANLGADRSVYLSAFQFILKHGNNLPDSKIRTDAVIHENQKLILGKLHLNYRDQADLFVVLTSRLH